MDNSNEIRKDATVELQTEWQLPATTGLSEEELLDLLTEKIAAIIAKGADPFYQLMYRLDISEKKLAELQGGTDVARKVAELVYRRQLEKIKSREKYRNSKSDTDPDLQW